MLFHAMLKAAALQDAGPKYRYWAIFVVDNNGGGNIRFNEIELRQSPGGATVTTASTPVTSSGGTTVGSLTNLVDGNTTTPWASGAIVNNRIRLDLAGPVGVRQVAICAGNAAESMPKNFRVEGSIDGTNFDVVGTFTETDWTVNGWKTFDL